MSSPDVQPSPPSALKKDSATHDASCDASSSEDSSSVDSSSSWYNLPPELRTLSPGDRIQYFEPGYVAGDKTHHKAAQIHSINDDEHPLVLSNGDVLKKDHRVGTFLMPVTLQQICKF